MAALPHFGRTGLCQWRRGTQRHRDTQRLDCRTNPGSAAQRLSQATRDASDRDHARTAFSQLRPASGGKRALEVCFLGSRRRDCAGAQRCLLGEKPVSDSIRIRIIPEALTQAAEYEARQLSVVEIPFGESRRWETEHGAEILRRPAIRDVYIAINTMRGPLCDVRVRRALNYAVDMPTILRTVIGGRGIQAAGALPPGILGYDSTRAPYQHDPAKARQLLAEAGYAKGFPLKLWRTAREQYSRIAQALQQQLGEVGITVEIVERDASSARAAARAGETDLFLTDWYADYPDPENFNYPLFYSGSKGAGGNYAYFQDTSLDSLILRARSTLNADEKARLAREIEKADCRRSPWIFCYFPVDWWARRNPRSPGGNPGHLQWPALEQGSDQSKKVNESKCR